MTNCIANELLKQGKTVLYQTAPVLLENVIDYKMNRNKDVVSNTFYKAVLDCDLLIITSPWLELLKIESFNSMKLSE